MLIKSVFLKMYQKVINLQKTGKMTFVTLAIARAKILDLDF